MKQFTVDFVFNEMGLTLNAPLAHKMQHLLCSLTGKKADAGESMQEVLSGVTGKLTAGQVTAIMGPSGAGKTTFMNTLAGKAYYGKRTGQVFINGKPDEISTYKKDTGFVPQEDIMHRNLTVRENLHFNARLRLPR